MEADKNRRETKSKKDKDLRKELNKEFHRAIMRDKKYITTSVKTLKLETDMKKLGNIFKRSQKELPALNWYSDALHSPTKITVIPAIVFLVILYRSES